MVPYVVPEQPGNQRLFDFLYLFSYKHICTLIHNKVTFPIYLEYLLLTYFKIKVWAVYKVLLQCQVENYVTFILVLILVQFKITTVHKTIILRPSFSVTVTI